MRRPGPADTVVPDRRGRAPRRHAYAPTPLDRAQRGAGSIAESWRGRVARRFRHLSAHPILWARYVWLRELRRQEVPFDANPRFRDWRPMFRVARPAIVRLTGRPAGEIDAFFAELAPLHSALRRDIGAVRSAGALMQAPLLYVLVRALRPKRVVETGISSGYSARLILEALERNGDGHLDSIGIDVFGLTRRPGDSTGELEDRHVGWLVPDELRHRWTLHLGRSEERLPALAVGGSRNLDLFVHDSLHQYPTMRWEYATALPAMPGGALLSSHDVHANRAWPEFLAEHGLVHDEELDHDLGAVRVPA